MRTSLNHALTSFSGALLADLIAAIVTILTVLIVPKFLGVEDFSYWQLYIFYVSYVGFMHFGWADGIYLRYGGKHYDELDKGLLSSQFWLLTILQSVIFMAFSLSALFFVENSDKILILTLTGLNCLLLNARTVLQFIMQSTNRIIAHSKSMILEKSLFVALIIGTLAAGLTDYEYLLAADIAAKSIMLIMLSYACRDIVFAKAYDFRIGITEAIANISVGVKLMFANIASLLIIGIVRFAIERTWNIETFGKISLTLTVANLVMIFINAASVVIFPIVKRTNKSNLSKIYIPLRTILMVLVLGALVLYYPAHYVLSIWLPDYADSLAYMALLFPICVYESKMSMLINTYLKALRKEKYILSVNVAAVLLSIIGSAITALWLHNLIVTVIIIVAVLAIRAILAEFILARIITINVNRDLLLELLLTITFIISSWIVGGVSGALIYIASYAAYLMLKRSDIRNTLQLLRGLREN